VKCKVKSLKFWYGRNEKWDHQKLLVHVVQLMCHNGSMEGQWTHPHATHFSTPQHTATLKAPNKEDELIHTYMKDAKWAHLETNSCIFAVKKRQEFKTCLMSDFPVLHIITYHYVPYDWRCETVLFLVQTETNKWELESWRMHIDSQQICRRVCSQRLGDLQGRDSWPCFDSVSRKFLLF